MAWPDPHRPGEPADPSRPWHWVARIEDGAAATPLPIGWNGALRNWMVWDGSAVTAAEAARRFTYLGPCLTPAEAQARAESAPEEPRGLAALAASATPPPPPAMVFRKDAVRNHLLIFAGTLFGTLFLAEKVIRW
ncbi:MULTISPECIES: hypothetical protein [Roseomonadaceae]|uniref:Uncharacterized protein n=1 Tax=Falsiroseomonas oleicola TaxID=2801474 RepID=A0ABS6H4L1_9PROT|nr:hypothetical protein [Roseomonas oleicola]MBU8543615.1 hypothetical protein [Roseomonas oleicola]